MRTTNNISAGSILTSAAKIFIGSVAVAAAATAAAERNNRLESIETRVDRVLGAFADGSTFAEQIRPVHDLLNELHGMAVASPSDGRALEIANRLYSGAQRYVRKQGKSFLIEAINAGFEFDSRGNLCL